MKQLTVITIIVMNLMTLMISKAQPLHRVNEDARLNTTNESTMNKNSSVENPLGSNSLTIYPNPTTGNLNAEINSDSVSNATLKIFDFLGNNILTESIDLVEGLNKITIELDESRSGIFFLKIVDGNSIHLVQRFTILK